MKIKRYKEINKNKKYKSKYIISKLGKMEPAYALSQTDANLTAILLGGKKVEHHDNFAYTYPSVIDKNKIPKEVPSLIIWCISNKSSILLL